MLPASCASFRSRIPAALTGELAEFESSEMRRHRQRCDPCHETLTGFETEYSLLSERGCEELLLARLELEQELADQKENLIKVAKKISRASQSHRQALVHGVQRHQPSDRDQGYHH